jgi:hypothetical protein
LPYSLTFVECNRKAEIELTENGAPGAILGRLEMKTPAITLEPENVKEYMDLSNSKS